MPTPAEYVALGAARQAAWVLSGQEAAPSWSVGESVCYEADATPHVLARYQAAQPLTLR